MSAQSTTTREFDGVAIYLPTTNPTDLFVNIPTDYAYDEIASRDNYDRLLCERIAAEFPGAVVTTSAHSAYRNHVEAGDSELADRVYESLFGEGERVAWIEETLYQDGEAWLVVATAIKLRERGVYTLPALYGEQNVELIACSSENEDGGYILYDRTEWEAESTAGLEADEDGNLTWWGRRADARNLTTADLVDTGRTEE